MRALITQNTLVNIGGSEVQAFELAQHLKGQGWEVLFYSWDCQEPMAKILNKAGFEVVTPENSEAEKLVAWDFDLIWVQHEVLPKSLIISLNTSLARDGGVSVQHDCPLIIFAHTSPYRELLIEQAWQCSLEDTLADAIVCNSETTQDFIKDQISRKELLYVYPNPAPADFVALRNGRSQLENILVVSNHAPVEILEAVTLLKKRGCNVDLLSQVANNEPTILNAGILDKYDVVISIGKTVQYCLVAGIPVFVYDHFGGPGYLNAENYSQAAYYNFSGRTTDDDFSLTTAKENASKTRLEPTQICEQIISGWSDALSYQTQNRNFFITEFGMENSFARLMEFTQKNHRNKSITDPEYIEYLLNSQQLMREHVYLSHHLTYSENRFREDAELLKNTQDQLNNALVEKSIIQDQLNNALVEKSIIQDQLNSILVSRSWRIAANLSSVYKRVKNIFHNDKHAIKDQNFCQ